MCLSLVTISLSLTALKDSPNVQSNPNRLIKTGTATLNTANVYVLVGFPRTDSRLGPRQNGQTRGKLESCCAQLAVVQQPTVRDKIKFSARDDDADIS